MNGRHERRRLRQILSVSARHGLRMGLANPAEFRLAMEELGPTFVKMGQILSTRPDLLPQRFIDEFQRLQDEVKPENPGVIRAIVEDGLKAPIEDVFAEFDEKPMASASVAQAHLARLKDGRRVVVKVQRPGIRDTMESDFRLLRRAAPLLRFAPQGKVLDPGEVLDEIWETTKLELDFAVEAVNMERFAENNRDNPLIASPRVHREYTTGNILIMEHIDGVKISDLDALRREGHDLHDLGLRLADNYFKQVFVDGFFHADPHPGNIVVAGPTIVYLDFGIMGALDKQMREGFNMFLSGVVDHDLDAMCRAILRIGVRRGPVDRGRLYSDIEGVYDKYVDVPLVDMDLRDLIADVFRVCRGNNVTLPREMTMLLRGIMTLEGVVSGLGPEINLMEVAVPYARDYIFGPNDVLRDIREQIRNIHAISRLVSRLPHKFVGLLNNLLAGRFNLQVEYRGMDRAVSQLSRMANRLVFGMVLSALIIASSLVLSAQVGPRIAGFPAIGLIGYLGAALMGFWLLASILRSGRM